VAQQCLPVRGAAIGTHSLDMWVLIPTDSVTVEARQTRILVFLLCVGAVLLLANSVCRDSTSHAAAAADGAYHGA